MIMTHPISAGRPPRERSRLTALTPQIVEELMSLHNERDLRKLLQAHRELDGAAMWNFLHRTGAANDPLLTAMVPLVIMIRDAQRGDVRRAWRKYRRTKLDLDVRIAALQADTDNLAAMIEGGEYERALSRIPQVEAMAESSGQVLALVHLISLEGRAAILSRSGNRADNLERAGATLSRGMELARASGQRELALVLMMDLASFYVERIRGDYAEDLPAAEALLREIVDVAPPENPEFIAMCRTNLATVLIRRNDRNLARLKEARTLCLQALNSRHIGSNPIGWAYSQLVLGDTYDLLAQVNYVGAEAQAENCYQLVIDNARELPDRDLVAQAHLKQGKRRYNRWKASRRDPDSAASQLPSLNSIAGPLNQASQLATDPALKAQALVELAAVYSPDSITAESVKFAQSALAYLRPTNDPSNCRKAAEMVGYHCASTNAWAKSARFYRLAIEAMEIMAHSRINFDSSAGEIQLAGNLYRWAAFSLAKDGNLEEAVITLEKGRSRQLRMRLPSRNDSTPLEQLPEPIRHELDEASIALRMAPFGPAGQAVFRRYRQAVVSVRSVPGFEDFGTVINSADLRGGIEPDWPVIYVNPTPWGTLLLAGFRSQQEDIQYTSSVVTDSLSGDLIAMLYFGVTDPSIAAPEVVHSYLLAIGSPGIMDERMLHGALDTILPWVGERIAKRIFELAQTTQAAGVTLIVSGPLAMVPLHAASWNTASRQECLIDHLPVRYAVSAIACAESVHRAEAAGPDGKLVALANPTGDLASGEVEVSELARMFGPEDCVVAFRDDATVDFLIAHGPKARYLHLACHASANMLGSPPGVVQLSTGPYELGVDTRMPSLSARLVMLSACQTAVSSFTEGNDESISLGAIAQSIGSACVIASLWPVNSVATSLLVVKLYEFLIDGDSPPVGLRKAQLWLRDVDANDLELFLSAHPALNEEPEPRRSVVGSQGPIDSWTDRVFAHSDYWASFVALGV